MTDTTTKQEALAAAYAACENAYIDACIAARLKYSTKTEAAYAIKNYAGDLYGAAINSEDEGEAVRAVAREFSKTYDAICDAAFDELEAEIAAAYEALKAATQRAASAAVNNKENTQ